MATTENRQQMMDAIKRAQADIASLADWFTCELGNYDGSPMLDWAAVGTLNHVRKSLIETLATFSGISESMIERSLDELHS